MRNFRLPNIPVKAFLFAGLVFAVTTIFHWKLRPDVGIVLYFAGALIGIYILDVVEIIIGQNPSPFRSILVQIILWVLAFFGLTSSAGSLGRGVILFVNFRLLYLQFEDFYKNSNLNNWLGQISLNLDFNQTKIYLALVTLVFMLQALLVVLV